MEIWTRSWCLLKNDRIGQTGSSPGESLERDTLFSQAPFGHGDKTIVDTSVRDTWELDASKFNLKNPEWSKFFDAMLQNTAAGLGLGKVVANPYKLLLYESGSFFKPHKDSEKEKGNRNAHRLSSISA